MINKTVVSTQFTFTLTYLPKIALLLFLFLLVLTQTYAQQPNVLWVTIEDTSPQFIGCYGNPDARTPVIDQLAQEGVRFTNAFSTGTVCSPSRSTIITGVRTFEAGTGNHRSQYPIPNFIKGFPYYLQQQGYYVTNNSKTDYNVARAEEFIAEAWDESSNEAGWWNRKAGQPFFAVFNFNDSHQSRTMTNPYEWYRTEVYEQLSPEDRVGENDFEMPPFYNDSPEMRKQFARVYNSIKLTDNKIGTLLSRLEQDQLMDSTIIFFYADHGEGIPRGKTNGINLGYRVPFVIWFPPMYRHLSPWGNATVSNELISFEDLAPTMISLAGGEVPDYLKGRVLMGENRSEPVDKLILSSDRSDNGIDMIRSVTDGRYVYSRNFMPFMPEARYIRYMEIGDIKQIMRHDLEANRLNALQKSLFEDRPPEFLYDLEQDVWETENLVVQPETQPLLDEMRSSLKQNVLARRDVLFLPEYELGQLSQTTTPYQYRLLEKKYPLHEIYEAALLSGIRSEAAAHQQLELLQDDNPIIRYWGAIGLRAQSKEALQTCKPQLMKAVQDTYPPVALTAAAIVYDIFGKAEAEDRLIQYCNSDNMDLALMAINYLLYVDQKAPFISTVKKVMEKEEIDYNVSAASKDFLGSLGLIPNNFEYR
uniref:Sulfatase-like hydrolase/transferase n=1 Tax=Roseihalotalea indica TaxID=2867963 RepID=A0AA49GN25_9BACT|nr:sulfatase-like hydrolase/transferase [Tunicatimonas sp. TK19036]